MWIVVIETVLVLMVEREHEQFSPLGIGILTTGSHHLPMVSMG